MTNTQFTIDSLKELNLKLVLLINELRKNNAEVKTENTRLKQAIEENAMLKIRFKELKKKNKTDTTILIAKNAELKDRVTKLEWKQAQKKNITSVSLPELEHSLIRSESLAESEILESSLSQETINAI
ncbi:6906_t:CDS:2 [Gigaspora rosea]|nr:6906_t:CDS:2 [Gigaspora rosea]